MLQRLMRDDDGFTLIEIVITIVVLAMFSVPVMMYFSDAMRHSVSTKRQQNAVVAAQDVLEELKAADYDVDDIDELLNAPSSAWSKVSEPDANGVYEVNRTYTVNGDGYTVKAKIAPKKTVEKVDPINGTTTNKDYKTLEVPEMDSTKDCISTETGRYAANAKFYFYGTYATAAGSSKSASVTESYIGQHLDRTIIITLEDGGKANYTKITVSYKFVYTGPSLDGITSSTNKYVEDVETTQIKTADLRNIYIFFNPWVNGDEIEVEDKTSDPGSKVAEDQLSLYLIAQNSIDHTSGVSEAGYDPVTETTAAGVNVRSATYKLTMPVSILMETAKIFKDGKIFTNITTAELDGSGSALFGKIAKDGSDTSLVSLEEINRVADIQVDVYRGDSMDDDNKLATVNGTKIRTE